MHRRARWARCGAVIGGLVVTTGCNAHHRHAHHHGPHGQHGHRFERASDWAASFDDPARDVWQKPDEVVAALRLATGMTVADVGAGTGYFESRLSKAVGETGRVLALDVEPDMVRHLGERAAREGLGNVSAQLVAGEDPGLAPASIDVVLVVDTWHHFGDREAYAAKLCDVLKPGGRLVVVDFKPDATRGPPPGMRLSSEEVMRDLDAGGLSARVVPSTLAEQYIVEGTLPVSTPN